MDWHFGDRLSLDALETSENRERLLAADIIFAADTSTRRLSLVFGQESLDRIGKIVQKALRSASTGWPWDEPDIRKARHESHRQLQATGLADLKTMVIELDMRTKELSDLLELVQSLRGYHDYTEESEA
jgi:hypothetical protein